MSEGALASLCLTWLSFACVVQTSVSSIDRPSPGQARKPRPAVTSTAEAELDPYTGYFVLGETPKEFEAIKYVEFTRDESTRESTGGFVVTDLSDPERGTIDIKTIEVRGRALTFETENRQGVTYKFEGRFLRGGDLKRFSRRRVAVMEAVVSKYRGKHRTASGRMRFYCVADAN